MQKKNKVLLLTTVYPYPVDNGKKVVLSGILKYLSENFKNVDVAVIGEQVEEKVDTSVNYLFMGQPNKFEKIINILNYSFLKKSKPIQESILFSKRLKINLKNIIQNNEYDLVICDTIRLIEYVPSGSFQRIIYMDDLFSIRYEKIIETIKKYKVNINPLGNFKENLPFNLSKLIESNFIKLNLLKFEKHLITKRENESVNLFDKNLLINYEEVQLLRRRTNKENIFVINPLVDNVDCSTGTDNGEKSFVFLGALNIPHNSFSLEYFIENHLSTIVESVEDFHLKVIGRNPTEKLKKLFEKYSDNITYKGYVEDLDVELNSSLGMLIPLIFGTGVKLKTIDAMKKGVPIITTSYGIEGINVSHDIHCKLEDDLDKYAQRILELKQESVRENLSHNAKLFYESNYTKEPIFLQYDSLFKN
ncbi:glycosyltransferase family 4 protein [Priestia aryabhattai]|uniref:glycosyltransferase family 4 protein n=1 Tax=Priestia aryabhattai TaxID=412384 RepID=UPI00064F5598|nr:glycosyltransferase [Priestia aryabhattai]KML28313.1 hypothetical protein VL11_16430 [Priestia aryabhattai]KMO01682.1 hypothetical protein ABV89_01415 [Priestia aryabhattai]